MGDLTVIVVTHYSASTIDACLRSLPPSVQVIVVDNASTDATVSEARKARPDARVIQNNTNRGFGAANNQGLQEAKTEYALLLNPDAYAKEQAVETLVEFMESKPDAVACGGRLLFPDGKPQQSAANTLSLIAVLAEQTFLEKLFHVYWRSPNQTMPTKVSQVMGACLLMRRVEGEFLRFDERFFLYCEDTELCKRLLQNGSLWYVPHAEFIHELGTSSESERWRAVAFYNRGKELYFDIHHGRLTALICLFLNRIGAMIRMFGWLPFCLLRKNWRTKPLLFWKVLTAPIDPYPTR